MMHAHVIAHSGLGQVPDPKFTTANGNVVICVRLGVKPTSIPIPGGLGVDHTGGREIECISTDACRLQQDGKVNFTRMHGNDISVT